MAADAHRLEELKAQKNTLETRSSRWNAIPMPNQEEFQPEGRLQKDAEPLTLKTLWNAWRRIFRHSRRLQRGRGAPLDRTRIRRAESNAGESRSRCDFGTLIRHPGPQRCNQSECRRGNAARTQACRRDPGSAQRAATTRPRRPKGGGARPARERRGGAAHEVRSGRGP